MKQYLWLLKSSWAAGLAAAVAVAGAAAVYAAQPSPNPHRPSPSPSNGAVQQTPAPDPSETPEPADSPSTSGGAPKTSTGHPCNHGWYVSQAAHKHAGGAYVSSVAQSDLGKNGTCTAPLPSPTATSGTSG